MAVGRSTFGAERRHVTLPTDFRSRSRERSFALRTFDGNVCPEAALRYRSLLPIRGRQAAAQCGSFAAVPRVLSKVQAWNKRILKISAPDAVAPGVASRCGTMWV